MARNLKCQLILRHPLEAKLIMQELWKLHIDWDESVPQALNSKWLQYQRELRLINQYQTKRQVILPHAIDIQLHGFCDASERVYGACIY